MTDNPEPQGNPEPKGGGEPAGSEDLSALKEQVSNLNKGVADYRSENKDLKGQLKDALEKIEGLGKSDEADDDNAVITPEDEKKLDALLKKRGVVLHADLQKKDEESAAKKAVEVESEATKKFLEEHPEYDKDDEWNKVAQEFALYKTPKTVDGYIKILNRIHDDLSGGDVNKGKSQARAEDLNAKRLSLGGGSQKAGNNGNESEDMDGLRKKYPNLSEEQIRSTLNDLSDIYPDKEE